MYIVLCCARVREIFLSPSREIHGGHNVSQQSYAVVKIFCPGKIAIPRSKKRSLPKDIVWLIPYSTGERWSSCFFLVCYFFYPQPKKTKSIARQFACPVWLVLSDCPFLVLFFFDDCCLRDSTSPPFKIAVCIEHFTHNTRCGGSSL